MSDISVYLPLWGQWNTEQLIGEGEDSKVYRAFRETEHGREYAAVKQYFVAPTEDAALAERRARTILALTDRQIALRGKPHLVEYYDRQAFHRADGGYDVFVRMELLTGLRSVMGKTEFSEAMLTQLGQDAAAALLTLEDAGTCHGALHPGNIFLSRDGTYKLGDYCRTRIRTGSGAAREYLAPEVLTGNSLPSVGSDRYALGMVLYRLSNDLRGPFLPPKPTEVSHEEIRQADRRRVRGDRIPAPARASAQMTAVLQKACAFEPDKRYPTTEALLRDLTVLQSPDTAAEIQPPAPAQEEVPAACKPKRQKPERKAAAKKDNAPFRLGILLAALILLAAGIAAAVILHRQNAVQSATEGGTAQTAEAVTTQVTTAEPSTTQAMTTEAPTTEAPTTEPPTTETPTTEAARFVFNLSGTYSYVDFDIPESGYVLEDSDKRYLTYDDLTGMTQNQCRIACNEIFARKGRKFNSQTMADYFGAMPWYNGTVDPSYFDTHGDEFLTHIEAANASLIVRYEKDHGWTW